MNTSVHTHILNRQEPAMCFHPNPGVQRWWQLAFFDRVVDAAAWWKRRLMAVVQDAFVRKPGCLPLNH